jgi:hypothetical protein
VEADIIEGDVAYSSVPQRVLAGYRDGWLPG